MTTFQQDLAGYSGSKLRRDLTAGLTVATLAVPQSMAYATIADINPIYGLYSAIVVTTVASIFNSSSRLIHGPTNAICIMFADMPWLIDAQPWIQYLPETYAEYWPEQRRLGRLHAMGYDAYNLIASLFATRRGEMVELDGATGMLFLDYDGRVHRRLAWAQFQRGQVVALPATEDIGGPIQDISNDGELMMPDAADDAPWHSSHRNYRQYCGAEGAPLSHRARIAPCSPQLPLSRR